MKKENIQEIINNYSGHVRFNTDIAVGRGINGIDYRYFDSQAFGIDCKSNYIRFSRSNSNFFIEYEHIVAIEIYEGVYNFKNGGIS